MPTSRMHMVLQLSLCISLVSHVIRQVEAEGDVATAFTLARILSNIPLSRGGPASVVIFDIHALQVLISQPRLLFSTFTVCWCMAQCPHHATSLIAHASGRTELKQGLGMLSACHDIVHLIPPKFNSSARVETVAAILDSSATSTADHDSKLPSNCRLLSSVATVGIAAVAKQNLHYDYHSTPDEQRYSTC